MRRRTVGTAILLTALVPVVIGGGQLRRLRADGDEGGPAKAIAGARELVKQLEERARATEADLKKARDLLAALEAGAGPTGPDTDDLEGVWRIVSVGGNREGGAFEEPPYDEYKIMTAGHYLWLSFDPGTGAVLRSGGGTYSLKDGAYTARVDYSRASDLRAVVGQEYKGRCRLEGKRCYHYGTMTNGAVFDELWERVH